MKLENLSIEELFDIRSKMFRDKQDISKISDIILEKERNYIDNVLNEDTATGGPSGAVASSNVGYGGSGVALANASIGGMGPVVSAQPSQFAGVTTEPGYTLGGGKVGSGDVSVPYNPGGGKKLSQKISANLRGTNKRRRGKLMGSLKNVFSKKQDFTGVQSKPKKIMSFDNFNKEELNKVTRIKD